jgi:hypothetical protein
LTCEGIFRICGRKTDILELKINFEQGESIPADSNPYAIAGLLSQFLQTLPEPLIPYAFYDGFIKAAGMPSAHTHLTQSIQVRLSLTVWLWAPLVACLLACLLVIAQY